MNIKVEKKDKGEGELEFIIAIPFTEQKSFLEKAASKMSGKKPIKGFRPGKAPFEAMEKSFGGETILEEALEELVSKSYYETLNKEKVKAIGQPKIEITKQAYGNDLEYKATTSLLPEVKIGEIEGMEIKKVEVNISDKEVDKAMQDICKMQAQEVEVNREARKGDLVEVDFSTTVDKVSVEGGDAKKYPMVLGDGHMIPGFEEQIEGLKVSEEKIFKLTFPKNYKSDLANKEAEFKVKLLSVKERKIPKLDDDFAKKIGQQNVAGLKKLVRENIENEAKLKEDQRQELEMLKKIVAKSEFSAIPKMIIHNEIHRIMHEIEDDLKMRGVGFEDYLKNIGKDREAFEKELEPKAVERVKTALVSRELSERENIKASEEEVARELEMTKAQYKNNPEVEKNIDRPEFKEYIANVLTNRKVIEWLKDRIVK